MSIASVIKGLVAVAVFHLLATPLAVDAQLAAKMPRIGLLSLNSQESSRSTVDAFREGLRERGWVDGQNIVIEFRYADGMVDRLPAFVAELIRLKVDIIVTTSSATTQAARDATRTIPIVMAVSADALGEGFVSSLAHPTGNITGLTFLTGPEISGKQLELLKAVAPAASRIAVLANPTNRAHASLTRELQVAARTFGVQLQVLDARSPDQLDGAFAAMTKGRAEALVVVTDAMLFGQRRRIVDLASASRLPAMYHQREFVDAGGLISYGASITEMFHRAATHVDKILKGAKPADIPVERPTKFELVVNLKTAKALGLTIPPALVQRADEVIQ
jgi:putative ABC transport system substrate-binding protein